MELVERLPGMCKALGSILSIAKKKKRGHYLIYLEMCNLQRSIRMAQVKK
jgi:hypothetical protein